MKQTWYKIENVSEFLAYRGQRKEGPHQMSDRILHWLVCSRCGLVALKNETTRKILRKSCVTFE